MSSRPMFLVAALASVLTFGVGCSPSSPPAQQTQAAPVDHRADDEAAIRKDDSAWVKAIADKDTVQAMAFYAPDAVLMAPQMPMAVGKDAIQKAWSGLMHAKAFALTFAPDKVTVAGDMAYEVGSYAMTMANKQGKPQTGKGKYVVIWTRQADGSWKAVLDAPTTTM